jgi:hypothetical protein
MLKRVVVMLATVVAGLLAPTMAATQTRDFSLTRWRHSAYRRMDA